MPPKRKQPKPVTDAERETILRLHAEGVSRNDICRQTGRSAHAVSGVVKAAGGSFARAPEVVAATQAKQIDLRVRRQAIVDRLYSRTEAVLDRLEADTYTYTLATVEGPETIHAEHPPAQDERNLANSMASYLGSAAKLEAVDAGDGSADARSMLGALAAGIRRIAEEDDTGEG